VRTGRQHLRDAEQRAGPPHTTTLDRRTVTHPQRIVVVVALAVVAVALHVALFDWAVEQPFRQPIFAAVFCDRIRELDCLAIWYDLSVADNRLAGILLGIVTPIALVLIAAYLLAALWKGK